MAVDLEALRAYCMEKGHRVSEEFPFGETTFVFKTEGKIFALISSDTHPLTVNLKCDPERAIELRERYDAIATGYHMNKKHWNTITLNGSIPAKEVFAMIDHSFEMVTGGKKKAAKSKKVKRRTRH